MKKQNTKTQLSVTEKMELLESRTKKFAHMDKIKPKKIEIMEFRVKMHSVIDLITN